MSLLEDYVPPPLPPLGDPGAAELDALLETLETWPEGTSGGRLVIPVTPQVIRELLRGTFLPGDGATVKMTGGSIYGNEFTPYFTRQEAVR